MVVRQSREFYASHYNERNKKSATIGTLEFVGLLHCHGVGVLAPTLDVGWITLGDSVVEGDGVGVLVIGHDVVAMKREVVAVRLGRFDVCVVVGVVYSAVPDGMTIKHLASDSDSLDSVGLAGQLKVICLGGFMDFGFDGWAVSASPTLIQIRQNLVVMFNRKDDSVCHYEPRFIDTGLIVGRSSPAEVEPVCMGVPKSELIEPKSP